MMVDSQRIDGLRHNPCHTALVPRFTCRSTVLLPYRKTLEEFQLGRNICGRQVPWSPSQGRRRRDRRLRRLVIGPVPREERQFSPTGPYVASATSKCFLSSFTRVS